MEEHIETIIENNNKPEIIEFFEYSGESIDIHENVLTEVDPTVPKHVKDITEEDIENWNKSSANASDIIYEDNTGQGVDNVQDAVDKAFRQIEGINDGFDNIDGKTIPFVDNYGYGTPDNIQDALDYAFEELDNRALYTDLNTYVSYGYNQKKNENQKKMARNNIGAFGIIDLGEIDLDEYQGDISRFLNTLVETGMYTFHEPIDGFDWFVEVYRLNNGSVGQTYWFSEEGYVRVTYRYGFYDEDSEFFDVFGEFRYLTSSDASNMFASKNHYHVYTISTSKDIRDYLNTYTNYANKDLRITSSINKHVYIVKLEFTNYSTPDGMRYVRYQEYYDIEEPNKIYKRMGTSKTASIPSVVWEDWYVFEGVSE